ncbi:MAG: YggT family protein [Gemmatimonadota bacterium]|nr:YggT family protein [Gemmatimonadota bacterium]
MLGSAVGLLDLLLALLRPAVFAAGALTAVAALVSYSARTRRMSPFSPLARFTRDRVDPWLIAPMERRILRAGGTPYAAPWWALAAVVVGGLVLLSAVGFLRDQLAMLAYMSGSTASLAALLVRWTFSVLRLALFARVIASWVGGGPYSKWWRWSYVLTEWFLAPLRQVVPTIGMIDITVLIAYFGLGLLESVISSALLR